MRAPTFHMRGSLRYAFTCLRSGVKLHNEALHGPRGDGSYRVRFPKLLLVQKVLDPGLGVFVHCDLDWLVATHACKLQGTKP